MSSGEKPNGRPRVMAHGKLLLFGMLSVAVLAAMTALGYLTISQLRTALQWRDHSTEVRGQIRLVRIDLGDMETGQRGFLLTGDKAYLAPYKSAAARVDEDLTRLAELTAGRPV